MTKVIPELTSSHNETTFSSGSVKKEKDKTDHNVSSAFHTGPLGTRINVQMMELTSLLCQLTHETTIGTTHGTKSKKRKCPSVSVETASGVMSKKLCEKTTRNTMKRLEEVMKQGLVY